MTMTSSEPKMTDDSEKEGREGENWGSPEPLLSEVYF